MPTRPDEERTRRQPSDDEVHEVSLLDLAETLLARWKLVIGVPFLATALGAGYALLLPFVYEATTTFVPESAIEGQAPARGGLASLAAELGVATTAGTAPRLYATILESRRLKDELLESSFPDPTTATPGDSAMLLDILGVTGETHAERLEYGRGGLDGALQITVTGGTNVVTMSYRSRHPELAAQVVSSLVDRLQEFNVGTRQSNTRARREFVEERVSEAAAALLQAEQDLEAFLDSNREFLGAPDLTFQHERLQRQVTIKQEVYITLLRQMEQARIEEVNDIPVITVIDRAAIPQQRAAPRRKLIVLVWFMVGAVLGIAAAFGRDAAERVRSRQEPHQRRFMDRLAHVRDEIRAVPLLGKSRRR